LPEKYRIFETDVFIGDLDDTPHSIQDKLKRRIKERVYPALRVQPFFGKNIRKLVGFSARTWRYRLGDYRIFYTIDDGKMVVSILTISDRKDMY